MKKTFILIFTIFISIGFVKTSLADVYGPYQITLKGYDGDKTNSVKYTGQMARHALHDSLKALVKTGDAFIEYPSSSTPLGIAKQKNENAYKLEKFKLNDSRVYCFTDGFSESLDENKNEIGINGVKELLKRNQNSKLKIELEKVTEEIRQKSLKKEYKEKVLEEDKGILDDDLTILGIGK